MYGLAVWLHSTPIVLSDLASLLGGLSVCPLPSGVHPGYKEPREGAGLETQPLCIAQVIPDRERVSGVVEVTGSSWTPARGSPPEAQGQRFPETWSRAMMGAEM